MDLLERLKAGKALLFDGAMGTMLQANGLAVGECLEEWNTSHSDLVQQIHRSYFEAGCDVVETNSLGGTRLMLARFGLADRTRELNRKAAENAHAIAGTSQYVAGSVGPTGEFIEPYGNLPYDVILEAFREQVKALEEGGADIICVETMSDLNEARAAVEAARKATKCVVFASMTFIHGKHGYRTMMGVDPASAARSLEDYGADVIGANCGLGPEGMMEILREMSGATSRFLFAKPNAGVPYLEGDRTVFPETPKEWAAKTLPLLEIGVKILGGCCGTTPEHLREIAKTIKAQEKIP